MARRGIRELSNIEKRDWLRLIRTQNVGPVAFRDLLRRYKSAGRALEALPDILRGRKLSIPSLEQVEHELDYCAQNNIHMLYAMEPSYPALLRTIDPPPPIISVWGDPQILHQPCIAIIGSRNASAMGQKFAHDITHELGKAGYIIVSGLARGIDGVAHEAALETGTIAVLGGGVDHIYPNSHKALHAQIRERGAIVSESPPGYRATARDFPRRNRIISGLSRGVVVIEAAERSGTLITARYALEQNREVMAAPGSPLDPRAKGCNHLIRQGAHLIETADDVIQILEDLRTVSLEEPTENYERPDFDFERAEADILAARPKVLALLSPTPTPRDVIIRSSGLPAPIVSAACLELELSGEIIVEPDGRVARIS